MFPGAPSFPNPTLAADTNCCKTHQGLDLTNYDKAGSFVEK